MKLINLTPQTLTIFATDGKTVAEVVPPFGQVARLPVKREIVYTLYGFPLFQNTAGEVEGLPDPAYKTIYIVSPEVRLALPGREDIASPGKPVHDHRYATAIGCFGLEIN